MKGKFHLNEKIDDKMKRYCFISEITIAELLYGATCSNRKDKMLKEVESFISQFTVLPIYGSLLMFAELKSTLRSQGLLIDDFDLLIGAFERFFIAGLMEVGAIHRGFSSYDKKIYRNLPQWHIPIELRRRIPELPIFCDPSHIGGKRELVAPLCQQAMDLGFDGLIVESHCNPDCAWSDAAQQVTPDVLDYILNLLVIRKETQTTENLGELRNQIDDCDNEIIEVLAKRMRVCREIGTFKKEHDMTILQTGRYNEILDKRGAQGSLCGMDSEFIKKVFEAIHEESVRQQMEIINK